MKTRADSLHAQGKEHDFLRDAPGGSHFNAKSDRLLDGSNFNSCLNFIKDTNWKSEGLVFTRKPTFSGHEY